MSDTVAEQIRPVARPRLYEVIVEQLCEHMANRDMKAGERLPRSVNSQLNSESAGRR